MSSRPSFERVEDKLLIVLHRIIISVNVATCIHLRLGSNMQKACRIHSIQTIPQSNECCTLWKKHEESIQTLEKVRIFLGLQKL